MASKTVSTATEMGMGPESGARFGNHSNLKNLPTYRCNRFVAPWFKYLLGRIHKHSMWYLSP